MTSIKVIGKIKFRILNNQFDFLNPQYGFFRSYVQQKETVPEFHGWIEIRVKLHHFSKGESPEFSLYMF